MPFAVLSVAILFAGAAPRATVLESASTVLKMNCIKTEFKIVDDNDTYVLVECEGCWKPWQATKTGFNVQKTVRKAGITAKPFFSDGRPIWESGVDKLPTLKDGKQSVFSGKIYGMSTGKKTYVILVKPQMA